MNIQSERCPFDIKGTTSFRAITNVLFQMPPDAKKRHIKRLSDKQLIELSIDRIRSKLALATDLSNERLW